jgi:hypothetical protein
MDIHFDTSRTYFLQEISWKIENKYDTTQCDNAVILPVPIYRGVMRSPDLSGYRRMNKETKLFQSRILTKWEIVVIYFISKNK